MNRGGGLKDPIRLDNRDGNHIGGVKKGGGIT